MKKILLFIILLLHISIAYSCLAIHNYNVSFENEMGEKPFNEISTQNINRAITITIPKEFNTNIKVKANYFNIKSSEEKSIEYFKKQNKNYSTNSLEQNYSYYEIPENTKYLKIFKNEKLIYSTDIIISSKYKNNYKLDSSAKNILLIVLMISILLTSIIFTIIWIKNATTKYKKISLYILLFIFILIILIILIVLYQTFFNTFSSGLGGC